MGWTDYLRRNRRVQKFNRRRPLVFLHIPKSAGTSLTHALLDSVHPRKPVVSVFDDVLFGTFSDFSGFSAAERERIYLPDRPLPPDADFVAGHLSFLRLAESYPRGQYITVLREPISRVISHWRYWRSHTDEQMLAIGAWADRVRIARGSLEYFLGHPDIIQTTDNLYVRMLLHPHPNIPKDAPIEARHHHRLVKEAMRKLNSFSLVGILEQALFERQLSEFLDKEFLCPRNNVTTQSSPSGVQFDEYIGKNAFNLLERRTCMDRMLWREFCSRKISVDVCEQIERKAIASEFCKALTEDGKTKA